MKIEDFKPFAEGGRYYKHPIFVQLAAPVLTVSEGADNSLGPAAIPTRESFEEALEAKKQPLSPSELRALPKTFVPALPGIPCSELRIEGEFVVLLYDGVAMFDAFKVALYVSPDEVRAISRIERSRISSG